MPDVAIRPATARSGCRYIIVLGNPTMGYIDIWGLIATNYVPIGTAQSAPRKMRYFDEEEDEIGVCFFHVLQAKNR